MIPTPKLLLGAAVLAALLSATTTRAIDVATVPLKASVLAKPNVVFAQDDSGSMDFELLVDGTRDGVVWGNMGDANLYPGGKPRNGTNAGDEIYFYLFPNGYAPGARRYNDWEPWGYVVPPTPQLAWTRSSDYNLLYYDSSKTYAPWSPAWIDTIGSVSYGNANPAAARSHPVHGSTTQALNTTVNVDAPDWRFTFYAGMTIPAGATNVQCWAGFILLLPATVSTLNGVCTAAVPYYPATFWKKQSCSPDGTTCVTNFDGATLKRYEIKAGNSYPSGRNYTDEMQNFANWFTYHRKRKLMLAAAMGEVLEDLTGMRLGVVNFNNRTPPTMMDADAAAPSANRLAVAGRFYTPDDVAGTPTHGTMAYVYDQFDNNASIVQYACQRNAMFVITDGFANDAASSPPAYSQATYGATAPYQSIVAGSMADKALAYFTLRLRATTSPLPAGKVPLGDQTVKNPDPNPNLHLLTYGLTLGAKGTLWPGIADPFATPPAWPATLTPGDPVQIDDLWHATINGRGQMYLASDSSATALAIRSALQDIAQQSGAQGGIGVSTVNLYRGDGLAYLASYNTTGWTGDLAARPINSATGAVGSTDTWSAATLLNARNWTTRVIASHNGTAGVAFTAAAVGNRVNPGNAWGTTSEVIDYLRGKRTLEGTSFRRRSSLIGAVINAEPVIDRDNGVAYFASGEGMLHAIDTRDSPGAELWAYAPGAVLAKMGASTARTWQFSTLLDGGPVLGRGNASTEVLVAGMGSAGRFYYALDVSSPRNLTEAQLATKVKWEFPASVDTTTQAKVGQTLGKPVFVRLPNGDYVVLVTSGYNSTADGKGRLWILNPLTGAVIHEFTTSDGSLASEAGLAQVSPFIAGDGSATYAYGGDLLGNVWRFDLVNRTAPTKVAQLRDGLGAAQPVTAAPELLSYSGQRIVLVGTGRLLGASDMGSTATQSFYAIADGTTLANARASLVQQVYNAGTDTLSSNPVDWATQRGWYVDLPAGQQANTRPSIAYGAVAFTTNQAGSSDCSAGAWLYVVDVKNGQRLPGTTGVRTTLSTTANSSGVTAVLARDGTSKIVATGQTTDGKPFSTALKNGDAIPASKNAWREIRR
jgi:type IV pilus assembly protein PilY1